MAFPAERIFLTGFPLPKENIGSSERLEVLRDDLFQRLLRLDPKRKFFSYHLRSVLGWLGKKDSAAGRARPFINLTFAIGGAGAQCEMARDHPAQPARPPSKQAASRITVSAGINERSLRAPSGISSTA